MLRKRQAPNKTAHSINVGRHALRRPRAKRGVHLGPQKGELLASAAAELHVLRPGNEDLQACRPICAQAVHHRPRHAHIAWLAQGGDALAGAHQDGAAEATT